MSESVRSRRVLVDGVLRPATVRWEGETVVAVDDGPAGDDLGDLVLAPGMVDSHVHLNDPGRAEWEGFATGTAAAAAGGVTTIVDMPLNSVPPTVDAAGLDSKLDAAVELAVDVGLWGGTVPGNTHALDSLAAGGVFGFKAFLVHSGVDEFPAVTPDDLEEALPAAARIGLPVLFHAEDPEILSQAPEAGADYLSYLASRPPEAELAAIDTVIRLAERFGIRAHVLHLSAAAGAEKIAEARARGLAMSVETCPHYLALAARQVTDTSFKCAPPIRDQANQDALWEALLRGDIDAIVSDHSPSPRELKEGGFAAAWGGISSLQLRLPVMWTAARVRDVTIPRLWEWLAAGPARVAGLPVPTIAVGAPASLVAWSPEASFTVSAADLQHRHPVTPYEGHLLRGIVAATWLRGRRVYDGARVEPGHGRIIRP